MKNRKKVDSYRFNGSSYFNENSIHSVNISKLEELIKEFEAKLIDPSDQDDSKWIGRWLARFKKELFKKQKSLAFKERNRNRHDFSRSL